MRLLSDYFLWHYTRGLADMTIIGRNDIWFISHLFSLSLSLRTLFLPWKQMSENTATSIIEFDKWAGDLIVNTLMRLVGFLIRSILIIACIACLLVYTCLWIALICTWILLPILIISYPIALVTL